MPKIVDWSERYELARAWIATEGLDTWPNVGRPGQGPLGSWWAQQRLAARTGTLTPERRKALEDIGFPLDPAQQPLNYQTHAVLDHHIATLKIHYAERGHYYVSKNENDPRWRGLTDWLFKLRSRYEEDPKDPHLLRIFAAVDSLEDSFKTPNPSPKNANYQPEYWRQQFESFKKAAAEWGNPNIPQKTPRFPKESRWLLKQRQKFNAGVLPVWQRRALQRFGVEFDRLSGPDKRQRCHYMEHDRWLRMLLFVISALLDQPDPERARGFLFSGDSYAKQRAWIKRQRSVLDEGRLPYCMEMSLRALGLTLVPVVGPEDLAYTGWGTRLQATDSLTTIAQWAVVALSRSLAFNLAYGPVVDPPVCPLEMWTHPWPAPLPRRGSS